MKFKDACSSSSWLYTNLDYRDYKDGRSTLGLMQTREGDVNSFDRVELIAQ